MNFLELKFLRTTSLNFSFDIIDFGVCKIVINITNSVVFVRFFFPLFVRM